MTNSGHECGPLVTQGAAERLNPMQMHVRKDQTK